MLDPEGKPLVVKGSSVTLSACSERSMRARVRAPKDGELCLDGAKPEGSSAAVIVVLTYKLVVRPGYIGRETSET